jgi:hypothetical protein
LGVMTAADPYGVLVRLHGRRLGRQHGAAGDRARLISETVVGPSHKRRAIVLAVFSLTHAAPRHVRERARVN